jgi:hypothetical protein
MLFGSQRDSERFYSRLYSRNFHANRGGAGGMYMGAVALNADTPSACMACTLAVRPGFPLVRPPGYFPVT